VTATPYLPIGVNILGRGGGLGCHAEAMSDDDGAGGPSDGDDRENGDTASSRQPVRSVRFGVRSPMMLGPLGGQDSLRRCSFCDRREDSVGRLATARGSYICDRCVQLAATALTDTTAPGKVIRIKAPRVMPVNRTDAEDAIERAYEIVLVSGLGDAERAAAIESGANLLPTMREVQSRFPVRNQLDITIEYIRFLDDHEAEVGFTLLLPGPRPVPGMQVPTKGYAVEQDGTWKVARATYAELIGRLGIRVPPPTET
jgi:hypothetical protein